MEIKELFEPVLSFIKNLQKKDKEPASKQAAKDRLKLVLMQDRASVSPDFFEMMKKEIIDVIKKYIEIDEEALEVELTRGLEAGLEGPALYANIPIKNVKPIAPKGESDDDFEKEDNNSTVMTEEEAEKTAERILSSIESMSSKENEKSIVVNEIKSEKVIEEKNEEEKSEQVVEKVKKEVKPRTKTKAKTTTTTTTQRKRTTTKKKE